MNPRNKLQNGGAAAQAPAALPRAVRLRLLARRAARHPRPTDWRRVRQQITTRHCHPEEETDETD